MSIGYFLSSEEFGPRELIRQATLAERHGFASLWISDHYHPWNTEQGESAFVWSVIGAISQVSSLPVTTAVTCPTLRIHPAIIAQAAATASVLLDGRFVLGVGSGEALNEHIFGDQWPPPPVRLEMLEEAVAVIRSLHEGGMTDHYGSHYVVENARLYTRPERPTPIYLSGFGPKSATLAGQIGDGYISTMPDRELVDTFKRAGGEGKPCQAGVKVCWAQDESSARKTAHRLWPNEALPGQLSQQLPLPAHFEQASTLVTEDMVGETIVCGPDVDRHVQNIQQYVDAGFDEVYVNQIGPDQEGFFRFYAEEILPRFS